MDYDFHINPYSSIPRLLPLLNTLQREEHG